MITVPGGVLSGRSDIVGTRVADFQLGQFEVTLGELKSVREWALRHGYRSEDLYVHERVDGSTSALLADGTPAQWLTWDSAVKWCNALSEKEGLTPVYMKAGSVFRGGDSAEGETSLVTMKAGANGYRLPTDAEWEWAATGGVKSRGYDFSGGNQIDEVGWMYNGVQSAPWGGLWPVGHKKSNELGFFDMTGNSGEWCSDVYSPGGRVCHRLRGTDRANWVGGDSAGVYTRDYGELNNASGFRVARSIIKP